MRNLLKLSGVYAASLTPLHENLNFNDVELANHCHDLIQRGCSGVVLFGTTGEGPSFSVKEKQMTLKKLIKSGIDPKMIIVGVICSALQDAVELTSTAIEQKCAAVMIVPPFF